MRVKIGVFLVFALASVVCVAQAPAGAPAGATGLCKDGTYYTGATKKGACAGHKGVKDWYGTPASGSAPAAAPAAKPSAAPTTSTTPTTTTAAKPSKPAGSTSTPAPGGGPGMVWVNTASNVYHCPGTQWYGKTKNGAYMSEADAKAKGARPDHGKACK